MRLPWLTSVTFDITEERPNISNWAKYGYFNFKYDSEYGLLTDQFNDLQTLQTGTKFYQSKSNWMSMNETYRIKELDQKSWLYHATY